MGVSRTAALVICTLLASSAADRTPAERFREAGEKARTGDTPKALAIYRDLAASGVESAALYWNWAQAAEARGAMGEALWALLRAREIAPGPDPEEAEGESHRDPYQRRRRQHAQTFLGNEHRPGDDHHGRRRDHLVDRAARTRGCPRPHRPRAVDRRPVAAGGSMVFTGR